uniref:Uncharacterized protein n=2 Tax=Timema TaxID=61471 RepID=A0A7R9EZC7_9NEOP|nr:unnamed protein product [Timema bartmani]
MAKTFRHLCCVVRNVIGVTVARVCDGYVSLSEANSESVARETCRSQDLLVYVSQSDINHCTGPLELLNELNCEGRTKLAALRKHIDRLESLAKEQEKPLERIELLREVASHKEQLTRLVSSASRMGSGFLTPPSWGASKRKVGVVSSAERGSLFTAVTCMNAAGHFVPPLLMYPRIRMKEVLLDAPHRSTIATCHKSRWIQTKLFTQ